ncbi:MULTISPECIES: TlpA family protein disulfide reductase [Sphingobacterium]|uniref:TlpA family protein disulfide reductase n=1 Tax=Sphingobacterium TaxID=28453 RepID=UPI00257EB34F|nr:MULTISPECIES: redoxin domain-containing protein [Sphingobacterium]
MRKKIRQGKTYFKGTSIQLKKRCKNSAQNLPKKADSSGSLRLLFECPSTLLRTSVASSSGMLRLLVDCASGRSRSVLEVLPKPSRNAPEPVSNMSRRSLEAEPEASRRAGEALPSSDFCLNNFAPTSAFHAIGIEFSSGSHRATPIKTRCGLHEKPMKSKNSAGIAQKMVDYSLAQEKHKLDYSATLGSPLLSPCYTQGQLNDCTSPIQQKQAFQQVPDFRLTYGVEPERSVLRFFKSICKVFVSRINTLLGSIDLVVQRALKCFLFVADYKRAYRMVLACLFLCLVSMFSLSAQTPRKDSGANGPSPIKALSIGDKIPQSLWDTPLEVVNHPTGQKTIKFSEYRDKKLIILDFWAVWCASCVESLGKIQHKLNYDQSDIVFIPVTLNTDTVVTKFQHSNKVAGEWQFPLVVGDKLLKQFFQHSSISHFVWLSNDGTVLAFTSSEYITDSQLQKGLKGDFADVKMKIDQVDFDPKKPLLIPELADLKARYTGFRTLLAGAAPTSGMQNLDSLGLKRRYFVNASLRSLCMDAMSDIQGIQLAKKKIVYEVIDRNRYFNKDQVNADVYNQQYGLCYEAVLPAETTKAAFRETLKNDLWQHFKIRLTIEERPIPVIALYGNSRKSHVSIGETIALKTLVDKLNVRDNDIPYLICPADLQNMPVSSNLKDCTSAKLLIERLAQWGIKADERKENLAVLVIKERRGA